MEQLTIESVLKTANKAPKAKIKLPKGIRGKCNKLNKHDYDMYLNYEDMVDMHDSELIARSYYRRSGAFLAEEVTNDL